MQEGRMSRPVERLVVGLRLQHRWQFLSWTVCPYSEITCKSCIVFMAHFDGVHAFGYNSAGSEAIWMKIGAVWVYCLPLSLARDTLPSPSNYIEPLIMCVYSAWPSISCDLSLDKHVSTFCAQSFFWLHQLRRVRRSLDDESMKTWSMLLSRPG